MVGQIFQPKIKKKIFFTDRFNVTFEIDIYKINKYFEEKKLDSCVQVFSDSPVFCVSSTIFFSAKIPHTHTHVCIVLVQNDVRRYFADIIMSLL